MLAIPYRRLVSFCRLYQIDDVSKPQKAGLHQREMFLFNDFILVSLENFSLKSLRYFPSFVDKTQIVRLDNHPYPRQG